MVVPRPGELSMLLVPSMPRTRSRIAVIPIPIEASGATPMPLSRTTKTSVRPGVSLRWPLVSVVR